MRSSAAGASASANASGCTCGRWRAASASATRRSTERLRASTITSPGLSPCSAISAATASATCVASCSRNWTSGSRRGTVSESRQTDAAAGRASRGARSTPGNASTAPAAAAPVVWARNGVQPSTRAASTKTVFSAASTALALRRVWSHSSTWPARPSVTNSRAASKTRGSARRKR